LARLVRSSALIDAFVPGHALVVITSPDDATTDAIAEGRTPLETIDRLASLPCIVIAVSRPPDDTPPLADLVIDPAVASLDDVLVMIGRNPLAATALALLLRGAEARSLGAGLAVESAVYSMLQAGAEFAAWRAATERRDRDREPGPPVLVERVGDRLDLVLNRPHVRNALNTAMRDGLLDALAVADADESITDVVIRGDGPAFCSGGDLDEFGSFDDPASAHLVRLVASIGRGIAGLGNRAHCEVHGACAGSGVELPAFAAHVVAHADFTASLPEVSLGLVPGAGGTVSVVSRIGRHRTALLALSGANIDAPTALGWGLIDGIDPR